ncbi:MAG TPA: polysaccharide deacetylase family protein, partial [Polymorphobacter sp.]|nr:polysaccharide deacetylase family protein [Polymorphobacter sp.]
LRDGVNHPRQRIFLGVWQVLNALPMAAAERLCDVVMAWAGVDRAGPVSEHTLTAAELVQIDTGGLVEIGGHTVSHLPLDAVDSVTAAREISLCRTQLGAIVGHEIESFSYPFGRIGSTTPALVEAAGFSRACTSRWQVAFPEMDRYLMPRITITDMDGDRFGALLRKVAGQ